MTTTPQILTADQNPSTPVRHSPSKSNAIPKPENNNNKQKSSSEEEESKSESESPSPSSSSSSDLFQIHHTPPAIQSMARDPNPNRIPSSVFTRGPTTTPPEWSTASNESVFSIRMGALMGSSGEVLSPEMVTSPEEEEAAEAAAKLNAEAMREVMRAAAEGKGTERRVLFAKSLSRRSDGSTTSFAFPILTGDGRVGSIKVNFEHQLNSQIKPSKIFADDAPTAMMSSHHPAHRQAPASVQSRWFPCFSCRRFCCC